MPRADSALYIDAADLRLVTGTPQEQEEARRQFRREREIRDILSVIKREIPRADLTFGARWIELESTGELFYPWAGDVGFAAPKGVVHYMDSTGFPRLLEPADPPSRAELEERREAKEQRRQTREAEAQERRRQIRESARPR